MEGLFITRWGGWQVGVVGWDKWLGLLVTVVGPSWIASRRYQVSINIASLIIRGVIFAT